MFHAGKPEFQPSSLLDLTPPVSQRSGGCSPRNFFAHASLAQATFFTCLPDVFGWSFDLWAEKVPRLVSARRRVWEVSEVEAVPVFD